MAFTPGSPKISIYHPTDFVMSATTNFNGAVPDGDISIDSTTGRISWAAGTNQGLVDPLLFGHNGHVRVVKLQLWMAGQATWTVTAEDPINATTYSSGLLVSGTTETYAEKEFLTILSPGQRIKVVTTGGATSVRMLMTLADARSVAVGARGF